MLSKAVLCLGMSMTGEILGSVTLGHATRRRVCKELHLSKAETAAFDTEQPLKSRVCTRGRRAAAMADLSVTSGQKLRSRTRSAVLQTNRCTPRSDSWVHWESKRVERAGNEQLSASGARAVSVRFVHRVRSSTSNV